MWRWPCFRTAPWLPARWHYRPGRRRLRAAYDWTGYYLGGHFSDMFGSSRWSAMPTGAAAPSLSGSLDFPSAFNAFSGTGSYGLGLQVGYNHVSASRLLLGAEADISFPDFVGGDRTFTTAATGTANYQERVELSGTLRGRIGYAPDLAFANSHWLFYATGGFAYGYDQFTRTQVAGIPAGGTATPGTVENRFMVPRIGGVVGAGAEVALDAHWAARFEYLYTDYANRGVTFPAGAQRFDSGLTLQTLRLGLDYKLGTTGVDPDLFTKGFSALELDRFALHGQTTLIEQYAPPFHSPYLGPHSLDPNQGRESWDIMYFVGAKLWQGAELWVDPEIDQGFGLSNTAGIAGFPSGASFKVGAAVPYARIERAFIRQTIDLGGDKQKVPADQNQFEGSNTTDRLVITVGKYSVSDVFDQNKYAQNPRKDFMNWALVDSGSFDYAADAWGYSYGASGEWYHGDWTVRGGVFDLSTVPNGEDLDPHFGQFQWLGEIERRYELWSHPGKIAITGFLTRGAARHLSGRRRAGAGDRHPSRYHGGAAISQPHRLERQSGAGDHVRSRRLCPCRFCQRRYRAGFLHRHRSHGGRRSVAQGNAMGPARRHFRACRHRQRHHQNRTSNFSMMAGSAFWSATASCRIPASSRSSRPIICSPCINGMRRSIISSSSIRPITAIAGRFR